jgi:hypothetical protein
LNLNLYGCGAVSNLPVSETTVYIWGLWSIGGQPRNHIAALDAATGLVTAWNPDADDTVYALAVIGTTVCAGGEFWSIGSKPRFHIAALDATTGLANSWNLNTSSVYNFSLHAMAVRPDRLYIGGDLSMIGGVFLTSFAQFDGLTAVELRSFTAEGYKDRVSLNWETGSEMHNAGFHLWRSRNEQGKYIKITRNFIPSEGETSLGAAYNHEDEKVQLGKTYYYRLKSFAEDGASVSYGPVSATVGGDLARLPRKWSHRFSW